MQTNLGIAALFVALARALGESDKAFPQRFDAEVQRMYETVREYPSQPIAAMEMLKWTHELLRGS